MEIKTNALKHLSVLYYNSKPSLCTCFFHTCSHPPECVYKTYITKLWEPMQKYVKYYVLKGMVAHFIKPNGGNFSMQFLLRFITRVCNFSKKFLWNVDEFLTVVWPALQPIGECSWIQWFQWKVSVTGLYRIMPLPSIYVKTMKSVPFQGIN
jgi:hypothetical protein